MRRCGVSRTVFLVGAYAIKVPSFRKHHGSRTWSVSRGIQANLAERAITRAGVEGVAPVLFSAAGLINVYPRCEPVDSYDGDYTEIAFWPFSDHKASNLGHLNGRVVWIDYDTSWNSCPHSRCRECDHEFWLATRPAK